MIDRVFEICGEREMTEDYKHYDFLKETEFRLLFRFVYTT